MAQDLTPKQEAFCLAFLETGNAAQAYRRAYDVAEDAKDGDAPLGDAKACSIFCAPVGSIHRLLIRWLLLMPVLKNWALPLRPSPSVLRGTIRVLILLPKPNCSLPVPPPAAVKSKSRSAMSKR